MTYSNRPFSRCTQPDALGLSVTAHPSHATHTTAKNAALGASPTLPQHHTWQFALSQAHARYWGEGA